MSGVRNKIHIILTVNGSRRELEVAPSRLLLDVLREDMDLTGTKRSCDDGECGSCMVLLGDKGVMSCLLPVSRARGKEITTIEGLARDGQLHPLQEAFIECGASQCGFCIPGMIVQAEALLRHNPSPTRGDVVKYLAHNMCRCTGYVKIIDAVLYAAKLMRGEEVKKRSSSGNGHIVGQSVERLDTLKEVLGQAKYAADLKMEGMIYAKVLRSPHHHARILSMDTSEAERMPGVEAVVTAKDIPGKRFMLNGRPQIYFFPEDKVRFLGEGLAAVAAVSEVIAAEAVRRIKVEYEPLPFVLDVLKAMKEGAPLIFPPAPNVDPEVIQVMQGDVEKGFAEADVIVENTYTTPRWAHAQMEPEAALAYLDQNGIMTIRVPQHHPFRGQQWIAEMLALPKSQVRIICPAMGGSFGARGDFLAAGVAALLALKTKRPVRIVYTRKESILGSCKTPSYVLRYKTGATRDGKLVAMEAEVILNEGSWSNYMAPYTGGNEMIMLERRGVTVVRQGTGPYSVPNVRIRVVEVCTNGPRTTPMRGTNGPAISFASESQMEQLAAKLGMDPIEFRLRNVLEIGSTTHYGQVLKESFAVKATLEALREPYKEALTWKAEATDPSAWKRGVGLACGWRNIGGPIPEGGMKLAATELMDDGRVHVIAGAVEKGQGITTVLAQIAAQELGLPLDHLVVTLGDTLLAAPYPVTTSSSSITTTVGSCVHDACRRLKKALVQGAAEMLEEDAENIVLKDGYAFSRQAPQDRVSFKQLATLFREKGIATSYEGTYFRKGQYSMPQATQGEALRSSPGLFNYTTQKVNLDFLFGYAAQLAQVEVNIETGQTKVCKIVNVCDAGTIINPQMAEGQVEGAAIFGLGFALREEFRPDPDRPPTLKSYGESTIRDVPESNTTIFVGDPFSGGPFGAKGIAEMPVGPIVPAIISAIADATGARVYSLPATADKVLGALSKR